MCYYASNYMAAFAYLVAALVLNALANIVLKIGATFSAAQSPVLFTEYVAAYKFLFLGVVLFASNLILYFLALRALPISVAYPVMVGGGFCIVNAYAYFFLNEQVTLPQIIGYACIVIGIALVVTCTRTVST